MKILIIGTGSIGQRHARVIHSKGSYEIAICDSNKVGMLQLAEELNTSECYSDYREAIAKSNAQVAIVCTPTFAHAENSIAALQAGMHVLCEKAMCSNSKEALAMLKAEEISGKKLMVGYVLRVNKALRDVKQILDSGTIGKPVSARIILNAPETLTCAKSNYRSTYETGGGIIFDYSHELDYSQFLFGDVRKCVCFKGINTKHTLTIEDNMEILLEFKTGMTASLHLDYMQEFGENKGRNISIVGEKGFIYCDFKQIKVYKNNGDNVIMNYAASTDDYISLQFDMLLEYMLNNKHDYCFTAADGVKIAKLIEELYKSAEKNSIEFIL
jgi:predicted dehydrogenase